MIKCSECGKEMSEKAAMCPNCGCPIDEILAANKAKEDAKEKEKVAKEERKAKEKEDKAKKEPISPQKKQKLAIIGASAVVVVVVATVLIYIFGVKKPREEALASYSSVLEAYNAKVNTYNQIIDEYNVKANETISLNDEFSTIISDAQTVIDCGEIPYEAETMTTLSNTLKNARNEKRNTPEIYEKKSVLAMDESLSKAFASEINEAEQSLGNESVALDGEISTVTQANNEIVVPDYSQTISKIAEEEELLEQNYAIQQQITNPDQEWVLARLNNVKDIANMAYVTEDNDPNGKLGKAGGYTSQIYFSTPLLNTETLAGDNLIDEGTSAGGSIEVYQTVENAESRNSYLSGFDGSIFDSGKHVVLGTMVVRVSTDLTATKQETLTNEIIDAFVAP